MAFRAPLRFRASIVAPILLVGGLSALLAGACTSEVEGGGSGGSSGDPPTGSGGNVGMGGTNTGGNAGTGGTNTGGAAQGGGGTGGDPGCKTDADCALDPKGKLCDTSTGDCVGCLPQNDQCPQGQYCSPATNQCEVGCTEDADCNPESNLLCDTSTHNCVGCVEDANCPLGSICIADTCVAGCNDTHPCQPGFSCCNSTCYDLAEDEEHCGDCVTACEKLPHAEILCSNGICGAGACEGVWADCDGSQMNGCEQNSLQDGPCACAPGSVQSCYLGAPGTEGVGPCHGGTQVCKADGLSWGPCEGQVLPSSEICANNVDENCDGTFDNAADLDGDGWTVCNGDCCDSLSECSDPKRINPGAFEFLNDSVDNDCDPATSDTVPAALCSTVSKFTDVTGDDVAKAMDLCQFTQANAPLPQKKWGVISTAQLLANGTVPAAATLNNMQDYQTAILTDYGTGGVLPTKGATMAGLSTGRMRDQNDAGFVSPSSSGSSFGSSSQPPAGYLAAHNGSLPASSSCNGACSSGSGANDSVNIKLTIRVPTNAQSFSYNFQFFSAEFKTFSCQTFNDFYLALLQTGAPGIPTDKNISFDALGNPVSVNNGFFDICKPKGCYTCPLGTGALAGTGMQLNDEGGGTTKLTTDAPIVPGETMVLELMVFDVSDTIWDSLVLLDNFTWNVTPAAVGTHE
jgi:hypothetical protein